MDRDPGVWEGLGSINRFHWHDENLPLVNNDYRTGWRKGRHVTGQNTITSMSVMNYILKSLCQKNRTSESAICSWEISTDRPRVRSPVSFLWFVTGNILGWNSWMAFDLKCNLLEKHFGGEGAELKFDPNDWLTFLSYLKRTAGFHKTMLMLTRIFVDPFCCYFFDWDHFLHMFCNINSSCTGVFKGRLKKQK